MTLQDYEQLCRYWADHPPVQAMIEAYLGIKPRKRRGTSAASGASIEQLRAENPDGFIK